MTKIKFFALTAVLIIFAFASSASAWNADRLLGAGSAVVAAATVSDADLIKESQSMRALGDKSSRVASGNDKYAQRLAKIVKGLENHDGLKFNFKVYITNDINANATPDGSIRVYSGLMDMMTDDELFFIIGHEIGHVKNGDALDAMRVAYIAAGGREAAASAGGTTEALSDSVLGDILEAVLNAQFSQSQESAADAYGYALLRQFRRNPQAGVTALRKLDSLGSSGGLLASHPNSAARAQAIAELIAQGK
jgi:putative metalloprotease